MPSLCKAFRETSSTCTSATNWRMTGLTTSKQLTTVPKGFARSSAICFSDKVWTCPRKTILSSTNSTFTPGIAIACSIKRAFRSSGETMSGVGVGRTRSMLTTFGVNICARASTAFASSAVSTSPLNTTTKVSSGRDKTVKSTGNPARARFSKVSAS